MTMRKTEQKTTLEEKHSDENSYFKLFTTVVMFLEVALCFLLICPCCVGGHLCGSVFVFFSLSTLNRV